MSKIKLSSNPHRQLLHWYQEALDRPEIKQPDAMTLATATRAGKPSARIVLFKGLNERGIRFFTNSQSRKGKELSENPYAALIFYWAELDRQIRVEGRIQHVSPSESDDYWKSRPRESQMHAAISPQSQKIPSRKFLTQKVKAIAQAYPNQKVPRPQHWHGYCLIAHRFEFWIADPYRLHDRFLYEKKNGLWKRSRLAP